MPGYKLTYLDVAGRAESTRILFTMAGVEFEDIRFPREKMDVMRQGELSTLNYLN